MLLIPPFMPCLLFHSYCELLHWDTRHQARRPASDRLDTLTDRERDVLYAIATGKTNAEIAETLFISVTTVKTHISRLLTKFGARDRTQLAIAAYETGLVVPGAD